MTSWIWRWLGVATLSLSVSANAEIKDTDFRVSDIQARLLYEQTGILSEDITDNQKFIAWNTVIGEGSAVENANDLLVSVLIVGYDQHNLGTPLIITVKDFEGRIVGQRTIDGMLAEPKTYRSLFLHDVGCAGVLRFEARLGPSVRSEEITLPCGE